MADRVGKIVKKTNLPIALCIYADTAEPGEVSREINLPVFDDIETALRGLASSRRWYEWGQLERTQPKFQSKFSFRAEDSLDIEQTISLDQALVFCTKYDINTPSSKVVMSVVDAITAANEIGYPIVLKILSENIVHKSDVQGVLLDLQNATDVEMAAEDLFTKLKNLDPTAISPSLLVQKWVPEGIELILGAKMDPSFGPVVMFGLGGIHVEVFGDVTFRIAPLSSYDAHKMIEEVRGSVLLDGYRGTEPVHRESIVQALLSLSNLMLENPQIEEIDLNPVMASSKGVIAVDARIRISDQLDI
jgi:acetyl-CoA synthetase (ADP-forming)